MINTRDSTVATRCESDSEISTDSSATNVLWSQKKKKKIGISFTATFEIT